LAPQLTLARGQSFLRRANRAHAAVIYGSNADLPVRTAHSWHVSASIAGRPVHRHIPPCRCDLHRFLLPRSKSATPGL